jgi:predicted DNA-binding transcriptional regulator AlpA
MKNKSFSSQMIDQEVTLIFDQLFQKYQSQYIDKKKCCRELGCSLSNLNKRLHSGMNIPKYHKIGNSKVLFSILEVAKYICSHNCEVY